MERPHKDIIATAGRALVAGGVMVSPTTVEWDISGRCLCPVPLNLHGRPRKGGRPDKGHAVHLDLETPCRKCEACLKSRGRLWRARAEEEFRLAPRTWFGTLTLRPDEQWQAEVRGLAEARARSIPLAEVDPFAARMRAITRWLTLYLKRLREDSGAAIRYLSVAERHASGLPHLHMLIHEVSIDGIVTHRQLTNQWPHGFTKWKLVTDLGACGYVTKYLLKSHEARVRASVRYGAGGAIEDALKHLGSAHDREITDTKSIPNLCSDCPNADGRNLGL